MAAELRRAALTAKRASETHMLERYWSADLYAKHKADTHLETHLDWQRGPDETSERSAKRTETRDSMPLGYWQHR